jgi:hypothetical protein
MTVKKVKCSDRELNSVSIPKFSTTNNYIQVNNLNIVVKNTKGSILFSMKTKLFYHPRTH